jgi:chorismate-pyruvate lyase
LAVCPPAGTGPVDRGGCERPVTAPPLGVDPIDRMVLTADGTVTTLLEACTGEPIVTDALRCSGAATLDRLHRTSSGWWQANTDLLALSPTERLTARRVSLRGARRGTAYVAAESLVVPDRLPDLVAHRLARPGSSLGRVLVAGRLETRREIVEIAAAPAGPVWAALDVRPDATLLRRTYTIEIGGHAVALVTEWLVPGRLASASCTPARPERGPYAVHGAEFVVDL